MERKACPDDPYCEQADAAEGGEYLQIPESETEPPCYQCGAEMLGIETVKLVGTGNGEAIEADWLARTQLRPN